MAARTGSLGFALATLLALLFWAADTLAQNAAPPTVTVAKPVVRDIVEDDEYVGRFEAVDIVSVRSRVGGYLEKVHFKDGALVKQGDLLFTIDQRPFETALDQAKSQLEVSTSLVEFTQSQLTRAEQLTKAGNMPVSTLDERRREFLSATAQVAGAKAAVTRAQLDMEFTEIRAPISGRIDRRLVSVGNLVQVDQTILTTIVSLDPINFYFDINERAFLSYSRDARQRQVSLQEGAGGLDVKVRLVDGSEPFAGKLDYAENRLDAETGTMRVRATFDNPQYILQPGLFGRVNVPGSLPHQGVLVPDEAIASDQDRRIVYVLDETNTATARSVRLGPRIAGYRVIRNGLDGTETIVINGLVRVRPGAKVTPEMVTLPPEHVAAGTQP